MSPEQEPEKIIMPSELRIMQRLGQVSTNASLRAHLFPNIAGHEREAYTPEELVAVLASEITSYSEEHVLGIAALTLADMPSYINALVDDDGQKKEALQAWAKLEEEGKINAEQREQAYTMYLGKKESRRDKKPAAQSHKKDEAPRQNRAFKKRSRKRR